MGIQFFYLLIIFLVSINLSLAADTNQMILGVGIFEDAVQRGDIKTVKKLLQEGEDVNQKAKGGYGPLHIATMYRHWEMVELLLEYGADINAKAPTMLMGDNGAMIVELTALELAEHEGYLHIAAILEQHKKNQKKWWEFWK